MHKFSSCAHLFIVSSIPHSQSGDCCKEELSLPIPWFQASWEEILQPPISLRCDFVSNSQKGNDFARSHVAFKLLLWKFLCSFIDMRWWWYGTCHNHALSGHALDILICVKSYIYKKYCVEGLGWTKIWNDTPTNHLSTDRVQGGCCSLCLHLWQAGACSSMVAISFSPVGPRRKRMQLLLSLLLLLLITKVRCLLCGIRLCTSGWNTWCWFWPSLPVLLL